MNKRKVLIVSVAIVLAAQAALLAHLILRWDRIVRNGVECRFKCNVFDPRDPFRGRFVQVSVEAVIEECGVTNLCNFYSADYFTRIEPTGGKNGLSRIVEAAKKPRADGIWIGPRRCHYRNKLQWRDKGTNETYEAFSKRQEAAGREWQVSLPGQLFVNENIAPKADALMRSSATNEIVAVYRVLDHKIVITGIEVNGIPLGEATKEIPASYSKRH